MKHSKKNAKNPMEENQFLKEKYFIRFSPQKVSVFMYSVSLWDLEETDQEEKINCKMCCRHKKSLHFDVFFMVPSKRFLCVNNVAEITQSKVNLFHQMLWFPSRAVCVCMCVCSHIAENSQWFQTHWNSTWELFLSPLECLVLCKTEEILTAISKEFCCIF